jgi:hypothetical protein
MGGVLAQQNNPQVGQQSTQPTAADLAQQKLQAQVQQAFALGWHMAELYNFDKVEVAAAGRQIKGGAPTPEEETAPTPEEEKAPLAAETPAPAPGAAVAAPATKALAKPDPKAALAQLRNATLEDLRQSLPGLSGLPTSAHREMLVRQVKHDLPDLWEGVDKPELKDLESKIDAALHLHGSEFRQIVHSVHEQILEALTVANFRFGKSYGLGRALAETVILPPSLASAKGVAASAKSDAAVEDKGVAAAEKVRQLNEAQGVVLHTAMAEMFGDERVFTIQAWLLDLRDCFPDHAADAVSTTLGGWGFWMVRPTIGERDDVTWNEVEDRSRITHALRRQGDMWRGLLSGEKVPTNIAGADYYFKAMAAVVRRVSGLALQFLGTTIGLLLALAVVVAGLALYFASRSNNNPTGVLAAVVGLLSALGVTTGSIGASIKSAWSKAEDPLWKIEVSAAVAEAAWQNPAPLGSVQQLQLLMAIGGLADREMETRVRHPNLYWLRQIPVGRLGTVLMVVSTAIAIFAVGAGLLKGEASFFVPPLVIVGFLVLIAGWDLLVGLASRQKAPYLCLPESLHLPAVVDPLTQWLAPIFLATGILAGHFFWH